VAAREHRVGRCGSNPMAEEAAGDINGTTDKWLDHAARVVPETDALAGTEGPRLRVSKAAILSGVG